MQPYQNYKESKGLKECPDCHRMIGAVFVKCPRCGSWIEKNPPVLDAPDDPVYSPIGNGVIKQEGIIFSKSVKK